MEQIFASFLCAAAWLTPCGASASDLTTAEVPCPIALGAASDAEEARLTNQALLLLLRGNDEQAASLLRRASVQEAHSPLTDVALLLCTHDEGERRATLEKLNANFDEARLTPGEAFYVRSFLALLSGDISTAAKEFRERAEQYRRDRIAACWDILLHHYIDRTDETKQRAGAFLQEYGDDGTVAYVCALVDEFAELGQVSPASLTAAQRATELMPSDLGAKHLYAHLLFLSGETKKAAGLFHEVKTKSAPKSYEWYAAGLYESSCLTRLGQTKAALKLRREMNAAAGVPEHPQTRAEILARWEVNFLPLRVLVTRQDAFDLSDIKAAALAATPKRLPSGKDAALCYRNTMVQILMARYHLRIGRKAQAGKELNDAAQSLEQLKRLRPASHERFLLSCHTRACEACQMALNLVRCDVFENTADIWREHAEESRQSATLLLPPLIPGRAGE